MSVITTSNQIANTLNNTYFSPACINLGEIQDSTGSDRIRWDLPADTNLWLGRHMYIEAIEPSIDSGDVNSMVWSYWISPKLLACIPNNNTSTNMIGCSIVNTADNMLGSTFLPVSSNNISFGRASNGTYYVDFFKRYFSIVDFSNEPELTSEPQGGKAWYLQSGWKWNAYIV